jgi:hypothetical protein
METYFAKKDGLPLPKLSMPPPIPDPEVERPVPEPIPSTALN